MHIEVFRDSLDNTLQSKILQWDMTDDEPHSYASNADYMIFFDDRRSVMLDMTPYEGHLDAFDVYINGDHLKTCLPKSTPFNW